MLKSKITIKDNAIITTNTTALSEGTSVRTLDLVPVNGDGSWIVSSLHNNKYTHVKTPSYEEASTYRDFVLDACLELNEDVAHLLLSNKPKAFRIHDQNYQTWADRAMDMQADWSVTA